MYQKYDTETLEKTLGDVNSGMSQRQASKVYGVPQTTISDYIRGSTEPGSVPVRPIALPYNAEKTLAIKVIKAAKWCLRTLTKKINHILSGTWTRKKSSLEHKSTHVVASKKSRTIPGRTGNSRDIVTVIVTTNGAGQRLPTLIIKMPKKSKGIHKRHDSVVIKQSVEMVRGKQMSLRKAAEKFNVAKSTLADYVSGRPKVPNLAELSFQKKLKSQFFFLDSHSSHEVTEMLLLARDDNIHVMTFPPHCTHHLQPLDKSVLNPLSSAYSTVCSEFMNTIPNNSVLKWTWPSLFKVAWESAVNEVNIKSGFHATGIYIFV
ncbi:LOW QUALITY PROTEIN: hypothetical protein KUTeg_012397 [Tegillarca granosa]|uniref:HTH psq-type domain-containing protein n=1 Tax=Tegillarca granosa TaxID=220873 RepID=A0ABQ9F2Q3_TEGGR|nr:LOW QUALITY PROTEIN: hypothetical protein KUTeg_012397 [Tegillarca granosa]